MQDIKVVQDENGFFDFVIDGNSFATEDSFASAIYVSLFSDARANSDQVKVSEHRRGWIANIATNVEGRELGSLLWLVEQKRLTQNTLNMAVDYAQEALQWMVDDNVATSVFVTGSIIPGRGVVLQIDITVLSGDVVTQYVDLWRNT